MVLLKSWSVSNIQQEFKMSNYVVQTTEKLVAERGISQSFASCNSWNGKQFYVSDEISRTMPGAKECAYVNLEGIHV
jgi:hypothetical protein